MKKIIIALCLLFISCSITDILSNKPKLIVYNNSNKDVENLVVGIRDDKNLNKEELLGSIAIVKAKDSASISVNPSIKKGEFFTFVQSIKDTLRIRYKGYWPDEYPSTIYYIHIDEKGVLKEQKSTN
jgi:hypothetical protein